VKVGEIWILIACYNKDSNGSVYLEKLDDSEDAHIGIREATIDSIEWDEANRDNWIGFHYGNNLSNSCFMIRKSFIETHVFEEKSSRLDVVK